MKKNESELIYNEKKESDHRDLLNKLEISLFSKEIGQGLPSLLNNGTIIKNILQNFLRSKWEEYNFIEVNTPILGAKKLYEISGHLDHYQEYMFPIIEKNKEFYVLRPMTCPHHCIIFNSKPRTYNNLPYRVSENALLFRYESSGSLKGLERTRSLELADHHVFLSKEQIKDEIIRMIKLTEELFRKFECSIERTILSLHDPINKEKYHNDEELWNFSESLFAELLDDLDLKYEKAIGEAAFYGPKLDFEIKNSNNKFVTIATIQLDLVLPNKFKLFFLDKDKKKEQIILIHFSPLGSYQRFISFLLEKNDGWLPLSLSPIQLALFPLQQDKNSLDFCNNIVDYYKNKGLRIKVFEKKTISNRIRQAYLNKYFSYSIIGEKELNTNKLELIFTKKNIEKQIIDKTSILDIFF